MRVGVGVSDCETNCPIFEEARKFHAQHLVDLNVSKQFFRETHVDMLTSGVYSSSLVEAPPLAGGDERIF